MACCGGKPLVLHEQNSIAGLANKVLAQRGRSACCVAFPNARPKAEWTGNPVRAELARALPPGRALRRPQRPAASAGRRRQPGRAGAERNACRRRWRCSTRRCVRASRTRAGAKHIEALRANYAAAGVQRGEDLQLVPFIDDMASAYADADLVICRAGAITVASLRRSAWRRCWCRSRSPSTITRRQRRVPRRERRGATDAATRADAGKARRLVAQPDA